MTPCIRNTLVNIFRLYPPIPAGRVAVKLKYPEFLFQLGVKIILFYVTGKHTLTAVCVWHSTPHPHICLEGMKKLSS